MKTPRRKSVEAPEPRLPNKPPIIMTIGVKPPVSNPKDKNQAAAPTGKKRTRKD